MVRLLKLKNPHRVIAIVGPDGGGKSYTIEQLKKRGNVGKSLHAMPITRWLPINIEGIDNDSFFYHVYFILKEILNGIERNVMYCATRLNKPDIMDRCFLDGCAYSQFFTETRGNPWIREVCEHMNWLAVWPDVVIQLQPTIRARWNPKRDCYTWEDIQRMNTIYSNILYEKGYRPIKKEEYYIGQKWYWRKIYEANKRIRISHRFKRKVQDFSTRAYAKYNLHKIRSKLRGFRVTR